MNTRLTRLIAIALLAGPVVMLMLTGLSCQGETQEKKAAVQPSDLPPAVAGAIKDAFPDGRITKIEKEVEGQDPGQYDVEIKSGAKQYELEVSPEGTIVEKKEVTAAARPTPKQGKKWTDSFGQENCTFLSTGRNRFFVLEPGYQLVLQSDKEKVAITVLNETKKVGDVETRIVEEREEEDGKLKEVSRNFYAICKEHGDVFYFGEEVDDYEDGKIVGHSGAWRADEKNSKAGIMMPGTALLGARHYQEIAPNAMDRAEIVADDVSMKTPAGKFEHCIKVEETTALDPAEKSYKTYAPGVGLVQDEDLLLVKWGKVEMARQGRIEVRRERREGKG